MELPPPPPPPLGPQQWTPWHSFIFPTAVNPSQWTAWHSFRFSTDGTAPAIATWCQNSADRAAADCIPLPTPTPFWNPHARAEHAIRSPVPARVWTPADSAAVATGPLVTSSQAQVWADAFESEGGTDNCRDMEDAFRAARGAAEALVLIVSRKKLEDCDKALALHRAAIAFIEHLHRIRVDYYDLRLLRLPAASAAAAPPGEAAKKRPASSLGLPAASAAAAPPGKAAKKRPASSLGL
jgi:hypothetical protein